jgi:ligand-binding sensor domain-containing protein
MRIDKEILWVGTQHGLNRMDRATGRSVRYMHDAANPDTLSDNYVSAILEDYSGTIWVTSVFANPLSALNIHSGKFTRYGFRSGQSGRADLVGVGAIHEDREGTLWFGTTADGLLKLDRDRKQLFRYVRSPTNPQSLHLNEVGILFEDSEGVIWAGTTAGISRFLRASPPFTNYNIQSRTDNGLQDNVIRSVQTDRKGFLWVGTETALHRLDRKTGRFTVYKHDPAIPHSISNNKVAAIVEELSGKIWFGSYGGGLNLFDPATGRFRAYRGDWDKPGALSSDQVSCLLLDREETLWVGTLGAGLNRFDRGHRDIQELSRQPS